MYKTVKLVPWHDIPEKKSNKWILTFDHVVGC